MTHYVGLVHKDADSSFGVLVPDVPGVFAAGDTIDEPIDQAGEALAFAAEDWIDLSGQPFPRARTIDDLRSDPRFVEHAVEAIFAAVPLAVRVDAAA